MNCKRCQDRGKTWSGDDPVCAFVGDEGLFDPSNWNCATMNALRDMAEKHENRVWSDDSWMSVLPVHSETEECAQYATHVIIAGYKNRGCTGVAMGWTLDDGFFPLNLELAELVLAQEGAT